MDNNLIKTFNEYYAKLNLEQKQAVDTIEGPVIVIAGAGTGKTQTIALRIAKILLETQVNPSNILCLTFTDSGVVAMRNRLISIIGATAYQIRLHTFHSFCNELVLGDPEVFGIHPASQPATTLEKTEIIRSCIDTLATSSKLKPWGEPYLYERDIFSQIQTLKREGVSANNFLELLTNHLTALEKLTSFYEYLKSIRATSKAEAGILEKWVEFSNIQSLLTNQIQRQFTLNQNGFFAKTADFKGALVEIFEDLQGQLPKLFELQKIYLNYQKKLIEISRYDYDDMILLVQKKFSENKNYLQTLQEQIQYILVDEYQDTNTAQNDIIYSLGGDVNKNIFAVGDDDQSIFRFQGASLENIYAFYKKYNPVVITLKHNYRSQPHVLTSAHSVINNNQNRIANLIESIDKTLTPSSGYDPSPINIIKCDTLEQEYFWISKKIRWLLQSKISPTEIAVLTRNNKQAEELSYFFKSENISFFLENGQDIFKSDYINQILHILITSCNPSDINTAKLYAILSTTKDIFEFTHEKIKSEQIKKIDKKLSWSQKDIASFHPHTAFLKILKRFNRFDTDYQRLAFLKTLSDEFLELSKTKTFSEILDIFSSQVKNNIGLNSSLPEEFKKDKVRIMTAHKSKGLEFQHVFIVGAQDKVWGNTRDLSKLRLPVGILPLTTGLNAGDQNEDDRRLFYVALTRAKHQIYISYVGTPSVFIAEIAPQVIENVVQDNTHLNALLAYFTPVSTISILPTYTDNLKNYLKNNYVLTATDINSYLHCPHCFYCEKILRLPTPRSKHVLYGTAIHNTLSQFYRQPGLTQSGLIEIFKSQLEAYKFPSQLDYQESLERGEAILNKFYYQLVSQHTQKVVVDYNFSKEHINFENIPITGKIDKISYIDNKIIITDFKTGNPDDYTKHLDYKRQLLFYYLLSTLSKRLNPKPTDIQIEYVEPSKKTDKFNVKIFEIKDDDLKYLQQEIKIIYDKIINLDFGYKGKDCKNTNKFHILK